MYKRLALALLLAITICPLHGIDDSSGIKSGVTLLVTPPSDDEHSDVENGGVSGLLIQSGKGDSLVSRMQAERAIYRWRRCAMLGWGLVGTICAGAFALYAFDSGALEDMVMPGFCTRCLNTCLYPD